MYFAPVATSWAVQGVPDPGLAEKHPRFSFPGPRGVALKIASLSARLVKMFNYPWYISSSLFIPAFFVIEPSGPLFLFFRRELLFRPGPLSYLLGGLFLTPPISSCVPENLYHFLCPPPPSGYRVPREIRRLDFNTFVIVN